MQRFFVPAEQLAHDDVRLQGGLARQIARVLRLRPGDEITLLDGRGWACLATLDSVTASEVRARVSARWRPDTEPRLPITLYQALAKGHRFDWALQKAVELGATALAPMLTEHGVARPDPADASKLARWQRIAQEAAEQCGRAIVPTVEPVVPFRAACQAPVQGAVSLMACLTPEALTPGEALAPLAGTAVQAVSLYVGPEGGFSPAEIAQAVASGVALVSLGPRT